jgi:3-deoxy-D-manno-octulosonic-acid transferase
MLLFYRLFIFLYASMLRVASLFNPKAKLFVDGRKDLLLKIKAQMGNELRPRIWMHCASLGEFEQGRPVLEAIRAQYPQYAIVLSFFSPSGYQVMKKYKGADYVYYLPIDTASNAKQFVLNINPALAIFVKYDLWYYYLSELNKKKIPAILIDAIFRHQQGFFKWYGAVQRQMLHLLTHIFVQNEQSIQLLNTINVYNATVAGDTRFDRVLSVAHSVSSIDRIEQLSRRFKLLIAGSTWAEDEELLATILPSLPPDWKLIIVPHDVDEPRILSVEKLFGGRIKRWSEWQDNNLDKQVLVIDTIGLLLKLYRYGHLAWIGGGLGKGGVHNVLEAAVYGIPCAYGPVHHKYQEAIELIDNQAAVSCHSAEQFKDFFMKILVDDSFSKSYSIAAKEYVASKGGATPVIIDYLEAKNWLRIL